MNNWTRHNALIDAHVHLWDVDRMDYPWLDEVPAIRKSFLIDDYKQATSVFSVEKIVFVQCECRPEQAAKELAFVLEQAATDKRIQGIVAYAPMEQGRTVKAVLNSYAEQSLVKGIRRMYDDDPALCTSRPFLDAVRLLPDYHYTFDVSVKPSAWAATQNMIRQCPDTLFVLDHLGKPDIKHGGLSEFKKNIDVIAGFPNVVAKFSGLITEANWQSWTREDIEPYVKYALNAFGYERLLFGSDWPVVLLAGDFKRWVTALEETLDLPDNATFQKIFFENATRVYRL